MLGSFEIGDYTKRAAVAMFLLFAFVVIELMLNLLIAIMGDAYSKVKESELVEGLHERAKIIVSNWARPLRHRPPAQPADRDHGRRVLPGEGERAGRGAARARQDDRGSPGLALLPRTLLQFLV
jgi:hypothetical protein